MQKHTENYISCVGTLKGENVAALKMKLQSQQNVSRKQSSASSSAVWASYRVVRVLAKESKPLS
jgi:mevalonate pyrophosphate decarboxylase